jgi:hypothetical protein
MNGEIVRNEEGQALVVVALAMFVLIGSIALSVDWGHSLLTRRGAQNEADAAALGAGRYLVSSYVGGSTPFDVSQEDVWCEARQKRDQTSRSAPTAVTRALRVSFHSSGDDELDAITTANCASPANTDVPASTRSLKVQNDITYSSLFGVVTRQPTTLVSTSASVRLTGGTGVRPLALPSGVPEVPGAGLSGYTTKPNVAIWPLVKHFDASDYSGRLPCGQYCDDTSRRFRLFPDSAPGMPSFDDFKGLVSYAHYSPRERSAPPGALVHQLITESDYTGTDNVPHHGHPTAGETPGRILAAPGTCLGDPQWDTNGVNPIGEAADCDIPNWFRYGYRGSVSIGTDWAAPPPDSWSTFKGAAEMPDPIPPSSSRASCQEAPSYFLLQMPSCMVPGLVGDWVETVREDMTPLIATQMQTFIQEYGRPAPNGRGLAVVVHVFLWDCADSFNAAAAPGARWERLGPTPDPDDDQDGCRIKRKDLRGSRTVDRVHLVSVVPVTVYYDDVDPSGSSVYAYWGGVFGDAGACALTTPPAGCGLNPLINSAFLVPDP